MVSKTTSNTNGIFKGHYATIPLFSDFPVIARDSVYNFIALMDK